MLRNTMQEILFHRDSAPPSYTTEPLQRARERTLQLSDIPNFEKEGCKDGEGVELVRKIGFLVATASNDWILILDVCQVASANEKNAKEAARALRREFKYGEPSAQLAAARLWALMLRNSSKTFVAQSTSRKFLADLEDLLISNKDTGSRALWRRVKPKDAPAEGVPFDSDDAMINPSLGGADQSD
ncbi:hypothetical protein B0H11DRAFT_2009616 [Mycena galericulata]|nr:hypothetical protein B0H11DRAFT_2009616 [Mycena galericulata]